MRTRLLVIAMAVVLLLGVSAPVLAATFGELITGSGPFGFSVQNNATTANAIGISGAMRSATASSTSTGLRGVNFGAGFGVLGLHATTTGTAPGVSGETKSTQTSAVGVLGLVSSTTPGGSSAAVRGINNGTSGS